jgi:hypothetical protein
MNLRRIFIALSVLVFLGTLGWYAAEHRTSTLVVRYAEPPARGPGRLQLASCEVRVETAGGKVLAQRDVAASPRGGKVRSVRIDLPRRQLASVQRVGADCTDAAGRRGEAASYALAPVRKPLTRMASEKR